MRSSLFLTVCAAAATGLISQSATAQDAASAKLAAAPAPENSPAPVGLAVAPGISFLPTAFTEIGYDTNPDQTANPKATAFSRSGLGFGLSAVSKELVVNVAGNGSWVDYFSDPERPTRLSGDVQANMTYLLRPGWTLSGSGQLIHDSQSFNQTESGGASVETAYRDDVMMTFLRGRHTETRYLNSTDPVSLNVPLLLGPAFNFNRSEMNWGGIYGANSWIGAYAELSAARIDYTDQPKPLLINRSADDYSAKAGTRLTLSPAFYTDFGWHWSWRYLDDSKLREYSSNFFDGALTWRPSPFFFVTASVQRTIGEATLDPALLSDIRSYEVKITYLPVAGITVSVASVWQDVSEIGSSLNYRFDSINSVLSYDYSTHLQLYTSLHYEYFSADLRTPEYDRFRILAGVRVIPDGNQILPLEPAGGYKDFVPTGTLRLPNDATLTASIGYSWFDLPAMKMVSRVGGPLWNEAIGQFENSDGGISGLRTDIRLEKLAEHQLPDGQMLAFGFSGFYAHYDGTDKTRCMYSAKQDCAFVNIADVSRNFENNTGPFGDLHINTYRQADYYGVGVDVRLADVAGGYKDKPASALSPLRLGFAFRGLDESTKVTGTDPLVCDPVRYREWLNTRYYGTYVGLDKTFPVDNSGWMFAVDGTAGLYYARSQYLGRYSGYAPMYGLGYVEDTGTANDTATHGAFIGTLRLAMNKNFGWASAGVYGQADYLSYAPKVIYNNNDFAGGLPWGIAGNNPATHIGSGDAMNYSVGLSLTFKTD
jgi:hypothetical protein